MTTPALLAPAEDAARERRSGAVDRESGRGILAFTRVSGKTVVTRACAHSPLRFLQPRTRGEAAWVYTTTYGGGLVGGDALALDVEVGAGAAALLTTQASSKVYRSARPCAQDLTARVGADGVLLIAPDPLVCFAGAVLSQQQTIELQPSASLLLIDWLSAGRLARGERWAFSRYQSRITITRAGQALVQESLLLDPAHGPLGERLGRFNVLALAILLGPRLRATAQALLTALAALPSERRPALVCVASRIGEDGALLRIGGSSMPQVAQALRDLCPELGTISGDDPWAGKW